LTPKTKYQVRINNLRLKLKPVSYAKKEWMKEKAQVKYWTTHYGRFYCLECKHHGHKVDKTLSETLFEIKCPSCKEKLEYAEWYNRNGMTTRNVAVVYDCSGDFQIIRMFQVTKYVRKDRYPVVSIVEMVQKWYDLENRKYTLFSTVYNGGMGMYGNGKYDGGDLSIKKTPDVFDYRHRVNSSYPVCPHKKISPLFKKAGFQLEKETVRVGNDCFLFGLMNPKLETIYKLGHYELFDLLVYRYDRLLNVWPGLKIAFRNKYPIGDRASSYVDYLEMLKSFGKDISNAHYSCPESLYEQHQVYTRKSQKRIDKAQTARNKIYRAEREAEAAEKLERIKEDSKIYAKRMKKYKNLSIVKDSIEIVPILTLDQMYEEGLTLEHCVFINEYYLNEHMVYLSARVEGEVRETIEINILSCEITQSRGLDNKASFYNADIVSLMKENLSSVLNFKKQKKKISMTA